MTDLYYEWMKVDDLAIKAVELSLPEHAQEVVKRIHLDYAQDIGVIGLLRRTHIEAGFDAAAQLFWASRREPFSPRLETVLAQLLLNIAASAIFDVIKELARDLGQIGSFIDARGITATTLQAGGGSTPRSRGRTCETSGSYTAGAGMSASSRYRPSSPRCLAEPKLKSLSRV